MKADCCCIRYPHICFCIYILVYSHIHRSSYYVISVMQEQFRIFSWCSGSSNYSVSLSGGYCKILILRSVFIAMQRSLWFNPSFNTSCIISILLDRLISIISRAHSEEYSMYRVLHAAMDTSEILYQTMESVNLWYNNSLECVSYHLCDLLRVYFHHLQKECSSSFCILDNLQPKVLNNYTVSTE